MTGPVETARDAWGDALPDWVAGLARECAATSQNKVARRMQRSASLVSCVLANKYAGNMALVEEAYRAKFENLAFDCPELGSIPAVTCKDWQSKGREFVNSNPMRRRMYRACHHCSRFKDKSYGN